MLKFYCNGYNSYVAVNGKANNNIVNFPTQFCLGSISDGSGANSREVSLYWNVYGFSVGYISIELNLAL